MTAICPLVIEGEITLVPDCTRNHPCAIHSIGIEVTTYVSGARETRLVHVSDGDELFGPLVRFLWRHKGEHIAEAWSCDHEESVYA